MSGLFDDLAEVIGPEGIKDAKKIVEECTVENPVGHKTYVTFGQGHAHAIAGKTFDRNCVAVIRSKNAAHGRQLAFEFFGAKFCFEYPEERWDEAKQMPFFPRGYLEAN